MTNTLHISLPPTSPWVQPIAAGSLRREYITYYMWITKKILMCRRSIFLQYFPYNDLSGQYVDLEPGMPSVRRLAHAPTRPPNFRPIDRPTDRPTDQSTNRATERPSDRASD
jgi:hypothetical protein